MREECLVTNIKGNLAYISLAKTDKCSSCKGCLFGKSDKIVRPAIMDTSCRPGDTVIVELPESQIISASLWLYLVPIIALVTGFLIGMLFHSEIAEVAFALGFAALSFVIVWLVDKSYRGQRKFMPVITEVIKNRDVEI